MFPFLIVFLKSKKERKKAIGKLLRSKETHKPAIIAVLIAFSSNIILNKEA